ncbi:DUF1015 family protein [Nocardioides zeae]|uniref:Uncharacterized protein (DUF1015 family) n=1 Tax=Nocardioides zeae TaxID=1457234 RepID=A0AAJ1X0V1_9ACTN|nr:DUF1015 family protein [Nocardioides zeae]MDQ1104241.1 uncharacterized protein (DUF1015 family) [Nocardioides zeae]
MDPADETAAHAVRGPFDLAPFGATRLSPARVGDPASARLLARPHRAVSERIQRWRRLGNLTQDDAPALYVHEYSSQGLTVRALVGLADLVPGPGTPAIRPHEHVDRQQAVELAGRMRAMRVNPAPLLLVHRGTPEARAAIDGATDREPDVDFVDRAGQRHQYWRVTDPELQSRLVATHRDADLVVADGHHRLAAYQQLQRTEPGTGWEHGLVMIVDQTATPLFLGAIHRVVRGIDAATLVEAARTAPTAGVRDLTADQQLRALGPHTMVVTDGERSWAVDVHDGVLPVDVLHRDLLSAVPTHTVEHHHSADSALARLVSPARQDEPRLVVLVPTVGYDAFARTVAEGRLLPEKATSFQPKPSIGAMMRVL